MYSHLLLVSFFSATADRWREIEQVFSFCAFPFVSFSPFAYVPYCTGYSAQERVARSFVVCVKNGRCLEGEGLGWEEEGVGWFGGGGKCTAFVVVFSGLMQSRVKGEGVNGKEIE